MIMDCTFSMLSKIAWYALNDFIVHIVKLSPKSSMKLTGNSPKANRTVHNFDRSVPDIPVKVPTTQDMWIFTMSLRHGTSNNSNPREI